MTQADLAERAGVTPTYLSKLEGAGAAPGIDLVEKLALALGATIADMIPSSDPADGTAVAREQARQLFETLLKRADQQAYDLLNPFLALLGGSAGKRG